MSRMEIRFGRWIVLPLKSVCGVLSVRHLGVVLWFNNAKGYGFLRPDANHGDVFVHHSGIADEGYRSLVTGEEVEFEMVQGTKGRFQAESVRKTGVRRAPEALER